MSNSICPNCGSTAVRTFIANGYTRCTSCDYAWPVEEEKPEPDPNNPYTDFAKEMSLLHEALKGEGFKDAMVDILAAMSPVVWEKVETKKRHERIEKNLEKLNGVVYKSPGWLETIPKEVEVRLE